MSGKRISQSICSVQSVIISTLSSQSQGVPPRKSIFTFLQSVHGYACRSSHTCSLLPLPPPYSLSPQTIYRKTSSHLLTLGCFNSRWGDPHHTFCQDSWKKLNFLSPYDLPPQRCTHTQLLIRSPVSPAYTWCPVRPLSHHSHRSHAPGASGGCC